jgi:hypothetical protein
MSPKKGACVPDEVEYPSVKESFEVALTQAEACLILSALARFEDSQVQWAAVAKAKGRAKEARARVETGRRCLALSDRIEKLGVAR